VKILVQLSMLAVLAPAIAHAQSSRYPTNPVDKEREAEATSKLWDQAIDPARAPYDLAVRTANNLITQRTNESLADAIRMLDDAIAAMPNRPEGYRSRGEAQLQLKHWVQCADDLQLAEAKSPRTDAATPRITERRTLGICQAHAGRLGDAERTLAQAAATGARDGELWIRLGEVRIAMGKLDEAKAALGTAMEVTDTSSQAMIHWLLAGAYDRSREPGNSADEIRVAAATDRTYSLITTTPFMADGESEYLLGLAFSVDLPTQVRRPEVALAYFKRFVKLAPQSPWRHRAEEHLRDLKDIAFPEVIERLGGTTSFDPNAARTAVRVVMPKLRACLVKSPNLILEVILTRVGPHSDARDRPRFLPPPAIPSVMPRPGFDVEPAERDAAVRCVDTLLPQIALPAVKDPDAYYKAAFLVIAP
jgi:tetratricopeptide (TPR) repeat protein